MLTLLYLYPGFQPRYQRFFNAVAIQRRDQAPKIESASETIVWMSCTFL